MKRIAFPILHAVTPQKNTVKTDHHAMMFCQMFFDVISTTSSGQRDMTAPITNILFVMIRHIQQRLHTGSELKALRTGVHHADGDVPTPEKRALAEGS